MQEISQIRSDRQESGEAAFLKIKEKIMEVLNERQDITDEELCGLIDKEILSCSRQMYFPLKLRTQTRIRIFNAFRRLDILQELVDDPAVTEIMVNGAGNIFMERDGQVVKWTKCFSGEEQLQDMIQQIVSRVNRRVNVSEPIADARLLDGSRVHIVLPPVALDGPVVTIRKFPEPITMKKLISLGAITPEAAAFLKRLTYAKYNIFISGGTNSGKTTFLNALSAFIPADERVITIEDSAELQIRQIPNIVRMETRNENTEGEGAIAISDLIRASLRMNPDRIIVGEVRGKEALDMLQAMNTGHDGSLSTGHGNSTADMISRLETMVLMGAKLPLEAIRSQISSAIDIFVHLGRLKDKSRKVLEIAEMGEYRNGEIRLRTLYRYDQEEGVLKKTGDLSSTKKLQAAGN